MKKRWFPVYRGCLHRLLASARFWVVLIVTALYIDNLMEPIHLMCKTEGLSLSIPGMISYMINDGPVTSVIALACMALLLDAPCADELQRYLMLRTGRKEWAKGQIAYCMGVAAVYMTAFVLIASLYCLPYLDKTFAWGEGMRYMYEDGGFMIYDSLLEYDPWLPRAYSAVGAAVLQWALHILMLAVLGMLLMNVNLYIDRRAGFAVVAAPVGFDLMVQEYFSESTYYFSPLTLCRLSGLDYGDEMGRPSVLAAFLVLTAAMVLLGMLFVRGARKREVNL